MDYNSDFAYDLKVGQMGEKQLGDIFSSKKIEVKRDFFICKTKRIAIEFRSRGKPSGISTTEADWWAIMIARDEIESDDTIILIEVERLKSLVKKHHAKGRIKDVGDNNTSKAVMIPVNELFK
jgi:hypothetical protein